MHVVMRVTASSLECMKQTFACCVCMLRVHAVAHNACAPYIHQCVLLLSIACSDSGHSSTLFAHAVAVFCTIICTDCHVPQYCSMFIRSMNTGATIIVLRIIQVYLVAKAEQERQAAVIRAEGEAEAAELISAALKGSGVGLIEVRVFVISMRFLLLFNSGLRLNVTAMCCVLRAIRCHHFSCTLIL
jgi:hypothetical protein